MQNAKCNMQKHKGNHTKSINLKYQFRRGMKSLGFLMDPILYQIFKIVLNIPSKNHREKTDNPSMKIYLNKMKNRITFKIETGYYLELSAPETNKLLGSNTSKIIKDKNGVFSPS